VKEPVWVTREVVIGGLPGVRDEGLLESALARPPHLFVYEQPDLFDLAAAYAAGIVMNHPFLDGNKRAGFMAAYTFLGANGVEFAAAEEEVVLQTLALAAGELSGKGYAAWLRAACRRPRRTRKRRPA
jgi:death on curing protein